MTPGRRKELRDLVALGNRVGSPIKEVGELLDALDELKAVNEKLDQANMALCVRVEQLQALVRELAEALRQCLVVVDSTSADDVSRNGHAALEKVAK